MPFDKKQVTGSAIPDNILDAFFDFLQSSNVTTKVFSELTESGDGKLIEVPTRKVTETRPNDLKAALAFFSKLYPDYFDPATVAQIAKMKKDSGEDDLDKFKKAAREALTIKR